MNTTISTENVNTVANTIKGNVFIIPNGLWRPDPTSEWDQKTLGGIHRKVNLPKDEYYMESWCYTPNEKDHSKDGESNWQCHYEMPGDENFPLYLPVSLFEDKKEGDTVEFDSKWGHIELKLVQTTAPRYRQWGTFEQLLKKLLYRAKLEKYM